MVNHDFKMMDAVALKSLHEIDLNDDQSIGKITAQIQKHKLMDHPIIHTKI